MKTLHILLGFSVVLFTGCDTDKPSSESASRKITVEDLAWATDWNIYKWKVSDLSDEELRQIQLVLIGSDGEIIQEGLSVGHDGVIDSNVEISLAFKKVGADVEVKLRGGGYAGSSTMKDVFIGHSWSFSPNNNAHGEFMVIATSSTNAMLNSRSALSESGNKLCLRLRPHKSEKQNKSEHPTPVKPSDQF